VPKVVLEKEVVEIPTVDVDMPGDDSEDMKKEE